MYAHHTIPSEERLGHGARLVHLAMHSCILCGPEPKAAKAVVRRSFV
jgi:hypothetical protein